MSLQASVIMAAWNAGPFIDAAVESVLRQDSPFLELIVVNDGSTDDTGNRVDSWAAKDSRVRVVHQENRGMAEARNAALRLARGQWIAVADADDIQLPHRLGALAEAVTGPERIDVCGGGVESWDGSEAPGGAFVMPQEDAAIRAGMLFESMMFDPTVVYRADLVAPGGAHYDPEFRMAVDYDLWWRLLPRVRFRNVPRVLTRYRRHPGQATGRAERDGRSLMERRRIWARGLQAAFGWTPSEAELEVHAIGATWRPRLSWEEASALRAWLHRIREANRRTGYFDPVALDGDLARRLIWAMRHVRGAGMRRVKGFFGSPLVWSRAVPLRTKAGLIVDAVLGR